MAETKDLGIYLASSRDGNVNQEDVFGAIGRTYTMSVIRAESIASLRSWAKGRTRRTANAAMSVESPEESERRHPRQQCLFLRGRTESANYLILFQFVLIRTDVVAIECVGDLQKERE